MPFKHNSARRHRIPKQKFKVTNWAEYEAGLRQRGSVTFWISEAAIAGWIAPLRKTRGGQCRYSDLAIETTLICGKVFNQPLRQTEGGRNKSSPKSYAKVERNRNDAVDPMCNIRSLWIATDMRQF